MLSCSSLPKEEEPSRRISQEAAKYTKYGNSFFALGEYDEAAQMYQNALDGYVQIDDLSEVLSLSHALVKALIYTGRREEAQRVLDQAGEYSDDLRLPESESLDKRVLTAEHYLLRGELAYLRDDHRGAMESFDHALTALHDSGAEELRAVLLQSRATVLRDLEDYDGARENLHTAIIYNTELNN
ncbi:MAG TPA: tetratricopeptide repeat protein, partial [Sediminispirochaeta sp.]|nr:tetratricopeptide repeat protein [Sediminispirochaeta sp.]